MRQWASTRILSRLIPGPYERCVDKHGQRVLFLSSLCNLARVTRKVPGHEDFFCLRSASKNLLPCAFGLQAISAPKGTKFRNELFFSLLQIAHQLRGYEGLPKFICSDASIARIRDHSNLILNLHHNYGVIIPINFSQVTHECCKGARVRFHVCFCKRLKYLHAVT